MLSVDHVVIGGGITGVCAAYHLAKTGAEVLLIERDELAPAPPVSSSGEYAKAFRTLYGSDRTTTRLCVESFKLWRQFEDESGTELFVPSGMVVFGADQERTLRHWSNPQNARCARESAAVMAEEGLSHEVLSKKDLVDRYPQIAANDYYDHAILDKTAGMLQARKAVREIGALAKKAGAVIWEYTTLTDCVRNGDQIERLITTKEEVVPRNSVIFAAGCMNSVFAPELRAKTRVTQQQIIFIKPRNPEPYSPDKFPIVINLNQWRYVFPLHGPGITKIADDDNYRPEKVIDPAERHQKHADDWFRSDTRTFLRDYVPGLLDSDEVDSTTCRYTSTAREKYLIYRKGNAVVISACSGHGFKNGPMTALMAVKLARQANKTPESVDANFGYEHADNF